MHHDQAETGIVFQLFKRHNDFSSAGSQRFSADTEKRHIGSECAEASIHCSRLQSCGTKLLQPHQRHRSIGAATSESCPDWDLLRQFNPRSDTLTGGLFELPDCTNYKIAVIGRTTTAHKFESIRRVNLNLIVPVDGLKYRSDFMIPVATAAKDSQIQINFRERSQQHKGGNKNAFSTGPAGTKRAARNRRRTG